MPNFSSDPTIRYVPNTDERLAPLHEIYRRHVRSISNDRPEIPEVTGNLGTRAKSYDGIELLATARRSGAYSDVYWAERSRYRGRRESGKFNLLIQYVLDFATRTGRSVRASRDAMLANNTTVALTDAEIANVQHVRQQIRFKEWLLLRPDDARWFL